MFVSVKHLPHLRKRALNRQVGLREARVAFLEEVGALPEPLDIPHKRLFWLGVLVLLAALPACWYLKDPGVVLGYLAFFIGRTALQYHRHYEVNHEGVLWQWLRPSFWLTREVSEEVS